MRRPPFAIRANTASDTGRYSSWSAGNLLGRAFGDHLIAAALRPHVDDPVGAVLHFQIVLDDHHRVALVNQFVQHVKQLRGVVEMKAGGSQARQGEGPNGLRLMDIITHSCKIHDDKLGKKV
jgi:hypothetical protein